MWAVLVLAQGLLPVATLYLTRATVNSVVAAIRGGGSWQMFGGPSWLPLWPGSYC